MNIDYALCEALKAMNLDGGGKVMVIYDVMCQYHVNLWKRISENPFLTFPQKVELLLAIGLFHVHGHRDECLFRFATSFIPGAGMVDGEILESLWAQLNDVSRSTRTSTLAHRSEVLDDHMNYSNWNKMVNIVSSVITKYNKSVVGLVDSQEYFEQLNNSALASDVAIWTQDIRNAEKQREKGNLKAMDIMEPAKAKNYEGKSTSIICIAPPVGSTVGIINRAPTGRYLTPTVACTVGAHKADGSMHRRRGTQGRRWQYAQAGKHRRQYKYCSDGAVFPSDGMLRMEGYPRPTVILLPPRCGSVPC